MNYFKKFIINKFRFLISCTASLALPVLVYAQTLENPLAIESFQCFVEEILAVVMQVGLPVVVIAIIYSGFLFVTAQGSEEKLKDARKAFMWSVIGGAVLLGSWALAVGIGATISAIGAPGIPPGTC